MTELPVVDLAASSAADAIDRACRDVGFFVLRGHGLTDDDGMALLDAARKVLATPASQIETMLAADDPNFRGFEIAGQRLAFEIGREAEVGRRLVGPNQWPECDEAARATVEAHFSRCTDICDQLLALLVESRRLGPAFETADVFGGPAHLRLWRYPEGHIDLPSHADHGFLTLLIAPDAGLEIQMGDGSFVAAPSAGGAEVLVNVARLLAHCSAGEYLPAVHRVRSASPNERYSAAFFYAPADHLRIAPPADESAEPRTVGDYIDWGYTWQHRVNAGETVADATDGAIDR
jgi:isopenicillin N synthase-like dioxygenase